jgi:hypothetical protein
MLAPSYQSRPLTCPRCQGATRLIALLTDPLTIRAALTQFGEPNATVVSWSARQGPRGCITGLPESRRWRPAARGSISAVRRVRCRALTSTDALRRTRLVRETLSNTKWRYLGGIRTLSPPPSPHTYEFHQCLALDGRARNFGRSFRVNVKSPKITNVTVGGMFPDRSSIRFRRAS